MQKKQLVLGVPAVIVVILAVVAWQLGLFSSEPDEANLDDALATVTGDDDGSGESGAAAPTFKSDAVVSCPVQATEPADESAAAIKSIDDLIGVWEVRQSEATFVGYRIDEILSGLDFEAVGRTGAVSGAVEFTSGESGQFEVSSIAVAANLFDLTSDSGLRDGQMKSQALETNTFPTACFDLTTPVQLGGFPVEPETFAFPIAGDLTIHGVTRPVEVELEATTSGGLMFVVGSTEVALADYEITTPSAPAVAGVSETATIEFSLVLGK
jgi:polyisoprenoid-binding protein YceI